MNDKRCSEPGCNSVVVCADGYCINHSPLHEEQIAKARVRGGQAVSRRLSATPGDIESHKPDATQVAALEAQRTAIAAMLSMLEADPHDLKVATQLSQATRRLSQQVQATDLEMRLAEIEKKLSIGKRRKTK